MAGGDRVCTQLIQKWPGFAVQNDSPTGRGHGAHGPQQGHIVELHSVIRLVEFEGGAAGCHDSRNIVQALLRACVPSRNRHVKAVIDGHTAIGLGKAIVKRLHQRLPRLRVGEINHRCTTSAGRGHSSVTKLSVLVRPLRRI